MAQVADVAEGGADLRQFVDELTTVLRGLLLVRAGADARLAVDFPAEDIGLAPRAGAELDGGGLSELVQMLADAQARIRDAQQFQVQVELALLSAAHAGAGRPASCPSRRSARCVHAAAPRAAGLDAAGRRRSSLPPRPAVAHRASRGRQLPSAPPRLGRSTDASAAADARYGRDAGERGTPSPEVADAAPVAPSGDDRSESQALRLVRAALGPRQGVRESLRPGLATPLSSSEPIAIADTTLVVAFATDFNRKRAERADNRRAIQEGVRAGARARAADRLHRARGQPGSG